MKLTNEQIIDLLKGKTSEELNDLLKQAGKDLPALQNEANDKKVSELEAKIAELEKNQSSGNEAEKIAELEKQLEQNKIDQAHVKELEAYQEKIKEQEKEKAVKDEPIKPMSALDAYEAAQQKTQGE